MRIEIIGKNYKPSDKLKEIIEKKLEKFGRYFEEDAIAKVVLKEFNIDKYAMEITINFNGGRIMRAEITTSNIYEAIDIVLPKLERQVRKYKTKVGKKIKDGGLDDLIVSSEDETTPVPDLALARTKLTTLKTLSVKDAIDEMEFLDHDFYVFVNEANNLVNIVYHRDAGGVGLLDLIY